MHPMTKGYESHSKTISSIKGDVIEIEFLLKYY